MKVITCPIDDIKQHEVFDSSCECGCSVEFVENGNMLIHHSPFDVDRVKQWGVFEEKDK